MGKGLRSQRLGLAAGLLCSALAVSSCLLPQNDDPLPEIPPQKNRPPRIASVNPARFIPYDVGPNCKLPHVDVVVEDPDVTDPIRIRWTVYDDDGSRGRVQIQDPPQLLGGDSVSRPSFSPPNEVFTTTDLQNTGMVQQLELAVADGEFYIENNTLKTLPKPENLPDGGTMSDITYIDTYTWLVNTERTPCAP
jgi:hypothetical protein